MPNDVIITGPPPPNPAVVRAILIEESQAAMRRSIFITETAVKAEAEPHRRTGTLLRAYSPGGPGNITAITIVGNVITGVFGTVYKVAGWLERGTGLYGPHGQRIVPKTAKVLSWVEGRNATLAGRQRSGTTGGRVFARSVRGIKPMHLFAKGVLAARPKVQETFAVGGRRIAARIRSAR